MAIDNSMKKCQLNFTPYKILILIVKIISQSSLLMKLLGLKTLRINVKYFQFMLIFNQKKCIPFRTNTLYGVLIYHILLLKLFVLKTNKICCYKTSKINMRILILFVKINSLVIILMRMIISLKKLRYPIKLN